MDSLTQIVLGAAVGEAFLGKKIGNKALLWGAIAGTIPDLDVFSRYFLNTVDALAFHRGITHSLLFCIALSPLLAIVMRYLYKNKEANFKEWSIFFFICLVTHPLLDAHTTWGTQFFWPLDIRLAYKNIFVIDPLYTLPFLICLVATLFYKRTHKKRRLFNKIGLVISSIYMCVTLFIKWHINTVFKNELIKQQITYSRFSVKPTPFNTVLWTANIETPDAYLIGYYSFFDTDNTIQFSSYPKNHVLIEQIQHSTDLDRLIGIIENWYALEKTNNHFVLNDLRFGPMSSNTGETQFAFSYKIETENGVVKITEKPKEVSDGPALLKGLWNRILGIE